MRYSFACYTDKGKRKEVNQDALLVSQALYHGREIVLAVICDGMGGLKQGELASAEVVGAFDTWFSAASVAAGILYCPCGGLPHL